MVSFLQFTCSLRSFLLLLEGSKSSFFHYYKLYLQCFSTFLLKRMFTLFTEPIAIIQDSHISRNGQKLRFYVL